MPRTCTVCGDPNHAVIDAALVAGTPYRSIAKQYRCSEAAVQRHKAHIPAELAQAQAAQDVAQADDLLAQVRALHTKALAILSTAEADGDLRTALAGIREARGCLELLAKLLGELDDRPQVNVLVSADWQALRTVLLLALLPYPEARLAVVEALEANHAAVA